MWRNLVEKVEIKRNGRVTSEQHTATPRRVVKVMHKSWINTTRFVIVRWKIIYFVSPAFDSGMIYIERGRSNSMKKRKRNEKVKNRPTPE